MTVLCLSFKNMFEGNLYIIENKEVGSDGGAIFTIRLLPSSPIYKGHFPDFPITPGVCLLSIVREITESLCGEKLSLRGVKDAKYLKVITPRMEQIRVHIFLSGSGSDENEGKTREVKAEVKSGENLCAKFRLQYEREAVPRQNKQDGN